MLAREASSSAPSWQLLESRPIDADVEFVLRGLNDFSPKPWPVGFARSRRQTARIEIRKARVQQGDTIAVGGGTLSINPQGRLEGQLNLTVAGLEAFVNQDGGASGQRVGFSVSLGLGLLARQQAGGGQAGDRAAAAGRRTAR